MRKIDTRGLSPEILAYLKSLEQKNQELTATVKAQAAELQQMNKLNELLVKTRHKMYGASSEQVQYLDAEQISFFNEAEKSYDGGAKEPTEATLVKGHARKAKRTKEELTKSLEHKKVLCELPEDERKCPVCGQEYLQIGEKFMRSELVVVPAQMYVLDYYCASYKCKACEDVTGETNILHANAPVSVMPKSMAAASTVAYIMQEKFQNGVPLYRQAEYWNGRGIDLKRNTMANWIIRSAKWFEPVWNLLRDELLSSNIVNADETDCHVLKEDGRESKQMSKMWVFCSPEKQIALYKYHPSRGGKVAQDMLKGFSGYLQSDGYSAYNAVENVTRVGCWAHARRKWVECFPKGVVVAGSCSEQAFGIIEKMFAIEKDWKSLSYEERLAQRKLRLEPLIEQYWAFLESFESEKDTNLYKAQQYSLNQRQYLDAILLDGRLELSNNLAERTVKPFVMARKNFLFSDTSKGAESSAHCFSVIETAKRNGLDVFGYLLFLLQELPKLGVHPSEEQLRPLLPWSTTLPDFCKKN